MIYIVVFESTRGLPKDKYVLLKKSKENHVNPHSNLREMRMYRDTVFSEDRSDIFTRNASTNNRKNLKIRQVMSASTASTMIFEEKPQLTLAPTKLLIVQSISTTSLEPTPLPVLESMNTLTETTASPTSSTIPITKPLKYSSIRPVSAPSAKQTNLFHRVPTTSPNILGENVLSHIPSSTPSKKIFKGQPSSLKMPPLSTNGTENTAPSSAPQMPTKIGKETLTTSPSSSTTPVALQNIITSDRPTQNQIKRKTVEPTKKSEVPILLQINSATKRPKLTPVIGTTIDIQPTSPTYKHQTVAASPMRGTYPISPHRFSKPRDSSLPSIVPTYPLPSNGTHPNLFHPTKKLQQPVGPSHSFHPSSEPSMVLSPTITTHLNPRRPKDRPISRPSITILKIPVKTEMTTAGTPLLPSPVTISTSVTMSSAPHLHPTRASDKKNPVLTHSPAFADILNSLEGGETTAGSSPSPLKTSTWVIPVLSIGGMILFGVLALVYYRSSQSATAGRDRTVASEGIIEQKNKKEEKAIELEEHNAYPNRIEKSLDKVVNVPRETNEESFEMHVNAIHSDDLSTLYDSPSQKADETYFKKSIYIEPSVDCDYGLLLKNLLSVITSQS